MEVIPSLDLLNGAVVRLTRGDFSTATVYGDPESVLDSLNVPDESRLHVVDLEASRSGKPLETSAVKRLASRDLRVQVGGGIRSVADARRWLECGAQKVVIGTVAADSPDVLRAIIDDVGASRVVAAVDVLDGEVRVAGWSRASRASLNDVLSTITSFGIEEVLITDISRDGVLRGPSFAMYRSLPKNVRVIASGGVGTLEHFYEGLTVGGADAALAASIFHFGEFRIRDVKQYLQERDVLMRPV